MTNATNLIELREILEARKVNQVDRNFHPDSFILGREGEDFRLIHKASKQDYKLNDSIFKYLQSKFYVGKDLIENLEPATALSVVNQMLMKKKDEEMLFRFEKNPKTQERVIRGILSKDYIKFDNLDMVNNLISTLGNFQLSKYQISEDDTLTMRILNKELPARNLKFVGQKVGYGIQGSNSELGFKSAEFRSYIEILRCTNGLTQTQTKELIRARHRGNPDISNELRVFIENAPKFWEGSTQKYITAGSTYVREPQKLIEAVSEDYSVGERVTERIIELFKDSDTIENRYSFQGVSDVYTEYAHKNYDMESRNYEKFESIGLQLLEIPRRYDLFVSVN